MFVNVYSKTEYRSETSLNPSCKFQASKSKCKHMHTAENYQSFQQNQATP